MSESSPSPLRRRLLVGRYVIEGKLGSGSLGSVYRARDEVEGRLVALKVLRTEQLIADAVPRLEEEFRAIASLRHPQIARAYDFGFLEEDGVPFFTREYIEGQPLLPGPPRSESASSFLDPIVEVLETLSYVHQQGILHLDVHAGNLIVAGDTARGSVLIDFGIAKPLHALASTSAEAWSAMAPEMIGHAKPCVGTDIYLVGRLLLYRLTGRLGGKPTLPQEMATWGPRLTLDLERILGKALERDPEDRFASAAEMRDAIIRALGNARSIPKTVEPQQVIFGREHELSRLDDVLESAQNGLAKAIHVESGQGFGKTRLLSEIRLRAQLRGMKTVQHRFSRSVKRSEGLAAVIQKLSTGRREFSTWLEAMKPSFGGSPEERATRAASAYFGNDEAALCLILDDIQLADAESASLIAALACESRRRETSESKGRGLALVTSSKIADELNPGDAGTLRLSAIDGDSCRQLFLQMLRPLKAPEPLLREALVRAKGIPLRLRRIAMFWRDEWSGYQAVPATAQLPDVLPGTPGTRLEDWESLSSSDRLLLKALAIADRSLSLEELLSVTDVSERESVESFQRLGRFEVVEQQGRGRRRRFDIASAELAQEIRARVKADESLGLHRAFIQNLESVSNPNLSELEGLSHHLLAAGEEVRGAGLALDTAQGLRRAGYYIRAVELLRVALDAAKSLDLRVEITEALSDVLEEIGDDLRAAGIVEGVFESCADASPSQRVRLARLLGVHLHRSGDPTRAREVFDLLHAEANEEEHRRDLILVDTELAEMCIFAGLYEEAEKACQDGLTRLEGFVGPESFRSRMNLMLRASRGHIELRSLRLDAARTEFLAALADSRRFGTLGDRAAILHNLGVLENQASRFEEAREYFEEAESILLRAGESQNVIKIATNLALIEAKIGNRRLALGHLETATSMLRDHSGSRLECFGSYSRGLVLLLFGECEEAIQSFRSAITLANSLGDRPLVRFAEIYQAEALLLCGRYKDALRILKRVRSERNLELFVERMACCRMFLAEALLGREKAAAIAIKAFEKLGPSELEYLEAWNEVFIGFGHVVRGADFTEQATQSFARSRSAFTRLGIETGRRFADLGDLLISLSLGSDSRLRERLQVCFERSPSEHRLLRAAEPVVLSAGFARLGKWDRVEDSLTVAGSHIVGSPFLEVDWPLEFLRSTLAYERGELAEARRHLHRCLHCRDLLTQFVPEKQRDRFLEHARFRKLNDAANRLNIEPIAIHSTERLRRGIGFDGLIGHSPPMRELFATIERLREHDVSVLIYGETGVGKDLVARTIHRSSMRSNRTLTIVECACLPEALFESELFGYVSGAFTDATDDRPGLLEEADGGTVLLSDVDQLSLESQAKLLRVIEDRTVRRVGGVAKTNIDVRYVATCHSSLSDAVDSGRFRRDLYYRLAGTELRLPPLRERREDIPLLVEHFLELHAQRLDRGVSKIDSAPLELLAMHSWPGNVRELESCLFRILIRFSGPETITSSDVREEIGAKSESVFERESKLLDRGLEDWRRELEKEYLTRLFVATEGDLDAMMARLEVKSTKLYAWFKDLGLDIRTLRGMLPDPPRSDDSQ